MTRRRLELGRSGEDLAAEHLRSRGYRIVARRYRTRMGEIDLVAAGPGTLVFVEVKTRRGAAFGSPAEAVHRAKQARLTAIASRFLAEHPDLAARSAGCRFDVVAITWPEGGSPRLEHLEDAFRPGV